MVRGLAKWRFRQRAVVFMAQFGSSPRLVRSVGTIKMDRITYDGTLADSKAAFLAAVAAVQPANLIRSTVQLNGNKLVVKGKEFHLTKPCHVVGFGKAVFEMAIAVEKVLGKSMKSGLVSVPLGTTLTQTKPQDTKIEVLEGALNNLPDKMAEENAIKILKVVQSLQEDDTLLVLISGGGSALLPLPLPPVTLEEKLQVIKQVASAGADIVQLNCIRKRLSSVKGGHLAAAAKPATVISLVLSDVIGDPLDIIASGPTSPNTDLPTAAWDVICQFHLQNSIPKSVQLCLTSKDAKSVDLEHGQVHNILIGNNMVAIHAAAEKMKDLNYSPCILSQRIQGNVAEVAHFYSQLASQICELISTGKDNLLEGIDANQLLFPDIHSKIVSAVKDNSNRKGIALIAGGETTVKVTGQGIGGRNQELALKFADESRNLSGKCKDMNHFTVSLMSAGTDGIDGPTNAAGAFGYAEQLQEGETHLKYLQENDSNTFYSKLNGGRNLIVTGHTGTNVMDIHILIIQNKQ